MPKQSSGSYFQSPQDADVQPNLQEAQEAYVPLFYKYLKHVQSDVHLPQLPTNEQVTFS